MPMSMRGTHHLPCITHSADKPNVSMCPAACALQHVPCSPHDAEHISALQHCRACIPEQYDGQSLPAQTCFASKACSSSWLLGSAVLPPMKLNRSVKTARTIKLPAMHMRACTGLCRALIYPCRASPQAAAVQGRQNAARHVH